MTTLIDDGLLESCLDEPLSLMDLDQLNVIDVDNIDAAIEDPGYILEEAPESLNKNQEFTTSSKKQSLVLPVTFFDISRNISLLQKCRPISIKIVDCHVYPWYYKEIKHMGKDINIIVNKENSYQQVSYDSTDLISSTCTGGRHDTCMEDLFSSMLPTHVPKISLTKKQRSVVLKLKDEFEKEVYTVKENKNVVDQFNNEKATSQNNQDLSVLNKNSSKSSIDQSIETHDLLTYKAIAQTIVCNIDYVDINTETDNVSVKNSDINKISENNILINDEKSSKNKVENLKEQRKKKMLPYIIKPKQKTKAKENTLGKCQNANNSFEKCSVFNKKRGKYMSSINQVIPHYHSRAPAATNNVPNFSFPSTVANQIYCQELTTKDSSWYCHQYSNNNATLLDNSDLTSAHLSHGGLVTSENYIGEMSYPYSNNKLCDNFLVSNMQATKQQLIENNNPNIYTISGCQYYYPTTLHYQNNIHNTSGYPSQANMKNGNSLRVVRRANATTSSKDTNHVYSQPSFVGNNVYNNNSICDSMCLLNKYINCSQSQIPVHGTVSNMSNIIQRNPLLNQLLNYNNLSEKSTLEQHGSLDVRPLVEKVTYPSMRQNFWFPPRPLKPPPSYEYHLSSMQYAHNKNFQYPRTEEINFHNFSSSVDTNLMSHKTNSNLRHSEIHPSKLTQNYNYLKYSAIGEPYIKILDSMKQNVNGHTEMQNIHQVPLESSENTVSKGINNMNTKISNQNIPDIFVMSATSKNIKIINETNIDAMDNISSDKKSNCLNSKANSYKMVAQKKVSPLKQSIFKPLEKHLVPEQYQSDTEFVIDKVSKLSNDTLQPTIGVNVTTTEKVESNTNGYSPPILPIPSFKKSLEMLSEFQNSVLLNTRGNNNLKTNNQEYTNITRKRKCNDEETMYLNSKRISLQEYKLRKSENAIAII